MRGCPATSCTQCVPVALRSFIIALCTAPLGWGFVCVLVHVFESYCWRSYDLDGLKDRPPSVAVCESPAMRG